MENYKIITREIKENRIFITIKMKIYKDKKEGYYG